MRRCYHFRTRILSLLAIAAAGLTASMQAVPAQETAVKPIKALLVLGGCCHDYKTQQDILSKGLAARARVEITIAYDPDTTNTHLNPVYERSDWASGYDVIIHDECSSQVKDPAIIDRILEPHRRGLPSVVLHCGMHTYRSEGWPESTPWFDFTGLVSTGHGPQAPIRVEFLKTDSPITRGFENWTTINEELYNNAAGKLHDTATALARGKQNAKNKKGEEFNGDCVVVWTNNYRGTKVFATTLGHNNDTVEDPRYLDMVTRGLLWSCDKLNDKYLKK
jgi:type 1 glutamine amidotransferase